MTKDGKFTAGDIIALLRKKYDDSRQWIVATEVSNTTGWSERRLDFVAANCYPSQGFGVHAFEVKISKSDLRRELENPSKHTVFFDEIDTYSIVAPDYVLDAEYRALIPPKWGIYTASFADGESALKTVRRPLALHDEKDRDRRLTRGFALSMLRAMATQDKKCCEQDALAAQYNEGYRRGREDGERQSGDWKRLYEEGAWRRKLTDEMRIYDAEAMAAKKPIVAMIGALVQNYNYFEYCMDNLLKASDTMRSAFAKLKNYTPPTQDEKEETT